MDPRNLIFGEKPQIGNPVHIAEYKRRALRCAGDLPLVIQGRYYDYELEEDVYEWRCPKCGWLIKDIFYNDPIPCPIARCPKEFELRKDEDGRPQIFVIKENNEV